MGRVRRALNQGGNVHRVVDKYWGSTGMRIEPAHLTNYNKSYMKMRVDKCQKIITKPFSFELNRSWRAKFVLCNPSLKQEKYRKTDEDTLRLLYLG